MQVPDRQAQPPRRYGLRRLRLHRLDERGGDRDRPAMGLRRIQPGQLPSRRVTHHAAFAFLALSHWVTLHSTGTVRSCPMTYTRDCCCRPKKSAKPTFAMSACKAAEHSYNPSSFLLPDFMQVHSKSVNRAMCSKQIRPTRSQQASPLMPWRTRAAYGNRSTATP